MPLVNYAEAFNDVGRDINDWACSKGFWDSDDMGDLGLVTTKLALISSEVSEALAVHRDHYNDDAVSGISLMTPMQEEDFVEELADIIIRTLDLATEFDLDIGGAIIDKIEKNRDRPYKHAKRY